ncbi:MAG TPA: hypothetical protein VM243_10245 [Phycisphaerae bacterium]|nr:hypothetical protein [Phycisphaerae bacterium]
MIPIPPTMYEPKGRQTLAALVEQKELLPGENPRCFRLSLSERVCKGMAQLTQSMRLQCEFEPLHKKGMKFQPCHAWEVVLFYGLEAVGQLPPASEVAASGEAPTSAPELLPQPEAPAEQETPDRFHEFLGRLIELAEEYRTDAA